MHKITLGEEMTIEKLVRSEIRNHSECFSGGSFYFQELYVA